jgi:hypothetical protein
MKYCEISVYHFSIVTDLAWLSSVTHMLSVSCLRGYFMKNPGIRDARVGGMACFFIILVTSCVFEIYHNQIYPNTDWSAPLRCRFSSLRGRPAPVWVIHLSLLLISYPISILRLYPESWLFKFCDEWIRMKLVSVWEETFRLCTGKNLELKHLPRLTVIQQCYRVANYFAILGCVGILFVTEFGKFLFVDQCGYLYYIVGITQLFYDLSRPSQLYLLDGSENTWGFGQLVPLFLIAIPLLSTLELFYGMFTNSPWSFRYLTFRSIQKNKDTARVRRQRSNVMDERLTEV